MDIVLLSLPNRNIDYPALSLPTLVGSLNKNGFVSRQKDLNIVIRDKLITKDGLDMLCERLLPNLICNYSSNENLLAYFVKLHTFLLELKQKSFAQVEHVKELLQQSKYEAVLCKNSKNSMIALSIFKLNRFLHNLLDFYAVKPHIISELGIRDPISDILDAEIDSICAENPLIVGFTVLEIQKAFTKHFIGLLKKKSNAKVLIGGAEASRYGKDYFHIMNEADFILKKDAENSLPLLIEEMKKATQSFESIPGLCYKQNASSASIKENDDQKILAADICSPCFAGINTELFLTPTLPVHASRACYWAANNKHQGCDFCVHHKTYSSFYQRTALSVVEDMKKLYNEHGARLFHLTDDALPPRLAREISMELIKLKCVEPQYDFKWLVYCRFEKTFDHDLLKLMFDAGVRVIEWGLETASSKILKAMNKGIDMVDVERIINISSCVGILNKLFCFHNYPTETPADLNETLDFLIRLTAWGKIRAFPSIRNKMYLVKGSNLYEQPSKRAVFRKVWEPSAILSIVAEYEDDENYKLKAAAIEKHLEEIRDIMGNNNIYSSDDDNVMLDLVMLDMQDRGIETEFNIIVPQVK